MPRQTTRSQMAVVIYMERPFVFSLVFISMQSLSQSIFFVFFCDCFVLDVWIITWPLSFWKLLSSYVRKAAVLIHSSSFLSLSVCFQWVAEKTRLQHRRAVTQQWEHAVHVINMHSLQVASSPCKPATLLSHWSPQRQGGREQPLLTAFTQPCKSVHQTHFQTVVKK